MSSEWASYADKSKFPAGATTSYQGKIYAVQAYVNLLALYYNKDVLDKAGVTPPTTLAELESDMAAAKAKGFGGITLAGQPNLQGAFQAYPWLTAAGFNYKHPTAKSLTKSFTELRSWVTKGWLSAEVPTWDQNVPFSTFLNGNIAFAENGNWQLSNIASTAKFKYGVVPLPAGKGAKEYLGGEAEAIGKYSKDPTLAFKYLQETFLSKAGQLSALKDVGSLPTRSDAAASQEISSDPYLSEFAKALATQGAPFPDVVIPPKNVDAVFQANGVAWSAALSGQQSPSAAAAAFLASLEPLLK